MKMSEPPCNTDEQIRLAKLAGWEWNTKVLGAFYHPKKKTWTHLLESEERLMDDIEAELSTLRQQNSQLQAQLGEKEKNLAQCVDSLGRCKSPSLPRTNRGSVD